MGNSDFKNRLLSFYGVKDTDFSDSTPLTGEERVAIVQNNLNVLATVNDLLSLIPCGFLNVPKNINSLDKAMDWFSKLKPAQGKKIGAVVSYFDTDSGVAEVMRFVGGNTLPETIKDSTNWEWFNSGSSTFKGLYNNEQELKLSAPSPKVGDHAFVGDTLENSTLYVCSKNGTWRKSKRLFNDIVSKFDAVFSVENGEQLEMYDEFIADKALMDAEGNVINETYLRISDREVLIENVKKQIEEIKKEKFAGINEKNKTFLNLNPDDLAWDMEDRLSFAERPNNTKSKYGFVYLRNQKPLTDDSFSRTGDKIIYAIRFNHDLGGRTINIPDNTVLDFTYGGSFTNGTLNLGKNVIIRTFDRDQIDVKINGQYKLMESVTTIDGNPVIPTPTPTPKPTPDPVVPPTPKPVEPTVVNANVYSSTNNTYTALDTNNLKNSNYAGDIYQGDVMSDGTFRVKKSLVHSTTNEVVYGNQPSYTNSTQFGYKGSAFKYAYNQVTHYWKDGQNTVFTYSTITGRNAGADYVEPVAPVTVARANVYSFSKTSFDEATSAKALERDYKNNLYLGNLMSDGTFQYIKDVIPTVGNANLFGRTENETDVRNLVTTKSAEYKYSYLTRQARWVDGANVIEYNKIVQRKPEYDYVAPITVVRPNVFSFSRDTFDEATSAKALERNFKNANLFLGNLMSDGSFQYIKFVVQNMDSGYKYGKTENETNYDALNPTKDATYRYGYYVEHPKWQDGNNIVEYKKVVRREPQYDYQLRTSRRDVASYKPNILEEVTEANLKSKNHTGPIYVGSVYEDNSYSGNPVEHKSGTYVAYSNNANETNFENTLRTGDATNKYAYDVTKHYWEWLGGSEGADQMRLKYFVGTRNTQRDFNAGPSIVNDYALSLNRNSYDEVTLDKIKAKGATINHNWTTNSIYIGKLKSDGSYEPTMALPYRNEYLVKYGATENETNVDNLAEYGNAGKPYAYNVINHIWAGRKPNGDIINYSYLSVGGRKSDSDFSPRKFIKTKNVFSYRQAVYEGVTSDNLKEKNHTGILWFGNEMSDGTMKNDAIQVQEQTSAVVLYGNRENLSDNPTFGNKSEVFKYAFNATNHKWTKVALNTDTNLNQTYTVEYNSHLSRNAAKDYGTQPVTPPAPPTRNLTNIVISPNDLSGETYRAGDSASYTDYKVRFLEDSGIKDSKIRTKYVTYDEVSKSFIEGEFEIYQDSQDPLKVYRVKSDGSAAFELVGELDYYSVDENSPGKNLNLEYKTVGNNKAFVIKDSRVPELENLIVFFGESRKRNVGIKDFSGMKGIYQGGKELTTVGSSEQGRLFALDTLLPVTISRPNDGTRLSIIDSDNSNREIGYNLYFEDSRRDSNYSYLIFYKAESLPEGGISIRALDYL